jgi:hypothetical protein
LYTFVYDVLSYSSILYYNTSIQLSRAERKAKNNAQQMWKTQRRGTWQCNPASGANTAASDGSCLVVRKERDKIYKKSVLSEERGRVNKKLERSWEKRKVERLGVV